MKPGSNLAIFLSATALAAGLFFLWVLVVRRIYRVRLPPAQLLRARCSDGWEIAVLHRPAPRRRFAEPILLCHGLAANRYNFEFEPPYSVAHALADAGFDCFTVEWRGAGASRKPPKGRGRWSFCVDDHIRLDAPALIDLALRTSGARNVFWLGHSLGGLIGLGVAQSPAGARIKGLLTLGAPVFFAYDGWLRRSIRVGAFAAWPLAFRQQLASSALAPFLGYVVLPFSDVLVNPRHVPPRLQRRLYAHLISSVSRKTLLQFADWIDHDVFRSFDGQVDYREGIRRLAVPLLAMGGSQDRLAPPDGVRRAFALAGSSDKTLMIFGQENGERQDYGHGDLIFGEGAPSEVYPRIASWVAARATAIEPEPPSAVQ